MSKFGTVPPEPKADHSLDSLAPAFREAVDALCNDMERIGLPCRVDETYRSPDRSDWLYGMGRDFDDGRGVVTHAKGGHSWHNFGVAADIVHAHLNWDAPESFWLDLCRRAEMNGLASGYRWKRQDNPHVQPTVIPVSPTDADRLLLDQGMDIFWEHYGL